MIMMHLQDPVNASLKLEDQIAVNHYSVCRYEVWNIIDDIGERNGEPHPQTHLHVQALHLDECHDLN